MKPLLIVLIVSFFTIHCQEDEALAPPEITIDKSPVWIGERSVAEEADPFVFSLHIKNKGDETLKITGSKFKGDQNCAFTKEGPDEKELGPKGDAFFRISYKPTVRADDSVSLIINSNSEKHGKFIVPICGRGVLPEELPDAEDTDSETEEEDTDNEDMLCSAPPADQPDCEESADEGK